MNFNKINILIIKNRVFYRKSLFVLLFFISATISYSQQDSVNISDSLVLNMDSVIISNEVLNTDSVNISESDVLKNDSVIFSDLSKVKTVKDSIKSDSLKYNPISPDAIDQVIEYNCNDSILFTLSEEKMYLYGTGDLNAKEINLKSAYVEINTNESYLFAETVKDSTG